MNTQVLVEVISRGAAVSTSNGFIMAKRPHDEVVVAHLMPFPAPDDGFKEVVKIENDKWFMTPRLTARLQDDGLDHAFQINAGLAVLNHFGLNVEYDREFVGQFDRHARHFMEDTFMKDMKDRDGPRLFMGEQYVSRLFSELFDRFLTCHGF